MHQICCNERTKPTSKPPRHIKFITRSGIIWKCTFIAKKSTNIYTGKKIENKRNRLLNIEGKYTESFTSHSVFSNCYYYNEMMKEHMSVTCASVNWCRKI